MQKPCTAKWTARLLVLLAFALASSASFAGTLTVRVVDYRQQPVPDVAVFIDSQGVPGAPADAVMDQRNKRFVPHLLVVERGALVSFPNSDVIAHHVYSFSRPNDFELPLYKGTPNEPVRFEHEGVVILGCNIHDNMLGYILVVGTDKFGKTDERGVVEIPIEDGRVASQVSAWSPRFRDGSEPLVQAIPRGDAPAVTFVLQKSLRPSHDDDSESVFWNNYD